MKVGILLTHPIQYYSPWFRDLSSKFDLHVYYAYKQDASGQADAGFGVEFEWDIPLLEGYKYSFLENVSRNPGLSSFWGCDTPDVYEIIKREKFDAFIVFGWIYKSAWQAVWACKSNKVPVFMRGDSTLHTPRSFLRSLVKYIPYRLLLPMIEGHLYVGELNKQYLKHYGVPEEKLFFIPHFVDNIYFKRESEKLKSEINIRNKIGIPNNSFVFCYVGKFIEIKKPDHIIKAYKRLVEDNGDVDIHLLFIGDGPLRSSLENLSVPYSEKIHFTGFINQRELPNHYSASNSIVLPGIETWGLVVNEAMACGLPALVSSGVGCLEDLIIDNLTGNVFNCGDVEELGELILKYSNNKTLIIGAGPAGLTAELELSKRGYQVEVCEADSVVGGISRTVKYKNYRFDIGGIGFLRK